VRIFAVLQGTYLCSKHESTDKQFPDRDLSHCSPEVDDCGDKHVYRQPQVLDGELQRFTDVREILIVLGVIMIQHMD
jgi:hypothetical protein